MHKKWIPALLLLTTILLTGCAMPAIPFLDNAPEAAPTAIDADTLATLVAEAAAQKVAQTLEAMPPTAAPTATVTNTPTPTEVPPTATPTAIDYPDEGSALIAKGNAYVYYDYNTAYKVVIPEFWLPIRPGEVEYAEAWGLPAAAFPTVNSALQSMQSLDPNTYRLFVLDIQEGHFEEDFLSNINIVSAPANGASLEEIFAQSVLELPDAIPGLVVTDSNLEEREDGQPYGFITAEWDSQLGSGNPLRVYQHQVIYLLNDTTIVLTLSSTTDFKDEISADFEAMVASFDPLP